MRTITYNVEAAPRSGIIISWEPEILSSDDSKIFSRPLWEPLD
jgi:hypothetical protein